MNARRRNAFDLFNERRRFLIRQYEMGDLTKKEFLEASYHSVKNTNFGPFTKIDSFEKGLFNYQYYNALAKYYRMLAKEMKQKRNPKYRQYFSLSGEYYYEKDKSTMALIRYLDFEGVEAYYIKVKAKSLQHKLYEIIFQDYREVVFHSKSEWIKEKLEARDIFSDTIRPSVIDQYVNEMY